MRRILLTYKREIITPDTPNVENNLSGIPYLNGIEVENNKIYYTSQNNSIVTPYSTSAFGSNILSNTFDSSLNMCIIEFDGNVTSVGDNAFRSCSALLNVILPNSVTSIGSRAFYYCSNLNSINTGDNIETIGASAFSTCNLINIAFGDKLKSIGQYGFYGCSSLEKIYIKSETPPTGAYEMFGDISENALIYVPSESVDTYKTANRWSSISDKIIGYDY